MFTRHSPPRGGRTAAVVIGLLLLAAVVAVILVMRNPGSADEGGIPTVDLTTAEPALAARIEERTAAVTAAPTDAEAWGRLGVAFDVHGYGDEAIRCYERAVDLDGEVFEWHYFLGHALRDTDPAAALAHFENARAIRGDYAPVHTLIGLLKFEMNDIDAADDALAAGLGLDDDMVATLLGRARVALARQDSEAALFYLDRADKLGPKEQEISALLSQAHEMAGNPDQAIRFNGIAGDDWKPEPLDDPLRDELWKSEGVTMAWRRRRSNEHVANKAIDLFTREWEDAILAMPSSAEPYVELGGAYGAVEEYDLAVDSFNSAIALDPANAMAHYGRGRALVLLDRADEGFAAMRKALEIDPTLREVRQALSSDLRRAGRNEEALDVLREGVAIAPDDADAYFDLGSALNRYGLRDEAAAALDRALALDPNHLRATFDRATIHGAQGDLEAAAAGFSKVVAAAPQVAAAHTNLGQAYLALGRTGEAVEALRLGTAHHPKDRGVLRALAWIYATNPDDRYRDGNLAVRLAQQLTSLTRQSDPDDLDILAAACAERGDWEVATRYAGSAIKLMSDRLAKQDDPAIRQRMAEVQKRLEQYHEKRPYRDLR